MTHRHSADDVIVTHGRMTVAFTTTTTERSEHMDACPNCQSDDWDFHNNDEARCRECGERWTVENEGEDA